MLRIRSLGFAYNGATVHVCGCTGTTDAPAARLQRHRAISMWCDGGIRSTERFQVLLLHSVLL